MMKNLIRLFIARAEQYRFDKEEYLAALYLPAGLFQTYSEKLIFF